jgi:hypothetical protein
MTRTDRTAIDCEDNVKRADLSHSWALATVLILASCTGSSKAGRDADNGGLDVPGADEDGGLPDGSSAADGGANHHLDDGGEGADGGAADGASSDGGAPEIDGGVTDGGPSGLPIALAVSTGADARAISPLIYGFNPRTTTCSNAAGQFGIRLCRLGGNAWSTYNWENNASNKEVIVSDAEGQEVTRCYPNSDQLGTSDLPAHTVTSLIAEAAAQSAAAVVTIPIIDYVAADKVGTGCPGDVALSGADYLSTRFKQNRPRKGAALSDPPDAADGVVNQDEFVQFVKFRAGSSRVLFTLDHQPELWSLTQVRVHPAHPTYEEVVSRNVTYATMLRDNWPGAEITGYGGYGYYAFVTLQNAPNPPGNMMFLDYYLGSMSAASTAAGKRLIDYLDIHWYSEATGGGKGILNDDDSAAVAEARVQAPRSLWDPTYSEASWIAENNGPIRLIPWIQAKIETFYPDTKLAISAWAYGGESSISGAIAVADALGIFGREGVALAALDPSANDISFALAAFAMFRNFDGQGAAFGDTSVRATTSDVERVSVYASTDSQAPGRVVIVAINRSADAQAVSLSVEGSGSSFTAADVYRLTGTSASPVPADPLSAASGALFTATLPPRSVSVIVPRNK